MIKMNQTKPLPGRLFKILQALIVRSIYKQSLYTKENIIDLNDAYFSEKQFIEEITKDPIPDSICSNFNSLVFYEASSNQRNLHKMVNFLYRMKQFKRFISFNKIDNNSLYQICNMMESRLIHKGNYIFKKNDMPDYFYGIISGEISIRKPLKQDSNEETEIVVLKAGDYFGEWGLLEEKRRTASAYACSDVNLFIMSPKAFTHTLMKCMKKAEYNRRLFIKKKIPNINNERLIDQLYKSLIRLMLRKGKVLYRKGEIANCIYLIYEGSVQIKNTNNYAPVLYSSEGDFLGLETIRNFENDNNKAEYKETVITHDEFNIIFKFSSLVLKKQYKGQVAEFFNTIFNQKNKIVNECLSKKSIVDQKTRINLRFVKNEDKKSPNIDIIEQLFDPINRGIPDSKRLLKKIEFSQSPINIRLINRKETTSLGFKSMKSLKSSSISNSSFENNSQNQKIQGRNANKPYNNISKSIMNNEDIVVNCKSLFSSQSVKGTIQIVKHRFVLFQAKKKGFTSLIKKSKSQAEIELNKMNISSNTLFFKSLNDINDCTLNKRIFNSGSISLPLVSLKANQRKNKYIL